MPAAVSTEDEFDSIYDDDSLLEAGLVESLAQVEASYTASQSHAPKATTTLQPSSDRLAFANTKRGSFLPPLKKQRLNESVAAPSVNTTASSRFARQPEADEVIVHNLRDEDLLDDERERWWAGNHALDRMEEEAIRMSQQMASSQRQTPKSAAAAAAAAAAAHRQRSPIRPTANSDVAQQQAEIRQLKEELDRLRQIERTHEEVTQKLKQEAYSKAGEVAVVRQNLTKLNQENAKLRERESAREQEHKATLDRLQLENQRQLDRLETETTFRRVEQDTSRRIWPSSVMRVAPVGLRELDRRQESQVRAGLTTPTKAQRFERRSSGLSSGSRQRYAADRDEPSTPTKSTTKAKQLFPAATSTKPVKSFKGFQNSFADFGSVAPPSQQQRTPSKRVDRDTSAEQVAAQDDGVVMAVDEHSQPRAAAPDHELTLEQLREKRYLFAINEMTRRRTMLVSHVLCHTSPVPALPTAFPTNDFNPVAEAGTAIDSVGDTTTLQRLLSSTLPENCHPVVIFRYRKAVDTLLRTLSQATVLELEEQWDAYELLHVQQGASVEEIDMSIAPYQMSIRIARSIAVIAGIALKTGQMNLIVDCLRLLTSLTSNVTCFASALHVVWNENLTQDAKDDENAYIQSLAPGTTYPAQYITPTQLAEILPQCVSEGQTTDVASADSNEEGALDIGTDAREDLLESVVQLLETIALLDNNSSSLASTLSLLQKPGFLHKLLHRERRPTTIYKTMRLIASTVSDAPFVHGCLAAKPTVTTVAHAGGGRRSMSGMDGVRMKAKFPVLEIMVKHLVDRRFDLPESEWHPLHRVILIFLTQAALRSSDTLTVLADSAALLAALIRCLSLDANFIFTESGPSFLTPSRLPSYRSGSAAKVQIDPSGANVLQATERLVMDIRLLNLLYNHPPPLIPNDRYTLQDAARPERTGPVSLTRKLEQPETYSMLNGIRQSFIVSLSRVAFCAEPEWMVFEREFLSSLTTTSTDAKHQTDEAVAKHISKEVADLERTSLLLEAIADVAGDLIDIVLSPDEIDSIYDLLVNDEADDEEEEDMSEDDDDPTQMEEDELEVMVAIQDSEPETQARPATQRNGKLSVSPQKKASSRPDSRSSTKSPEKRSLNNHKSRAREAIVIDDSE